MKRTATLVVFIICISTAAYASESSPGRMPNSVTLSNSLSMLDTMSKQ